jgi:hypothetical protein
MTRRVLWLCVLWTACTGVYDKVPQGPDVVDTEPASDTDEASDSDVEVVTDGPFGFIGSPCTTAADCDYDGAVCLTDGYPGGMCSIACERTCSDRDGHPVTFCVDSDDLPNAAASLGAGACHSRCDFGVYPMKGCRDGYGCAETVRANEPGTRNYACLPNRDDELSGCYRRLIATGMAFEPTIVAPSSPSSHPNLTCSVSDAVYVLGEVEGVGLEYLGTPTRRVLGTCEMAMSLRDTVLDVKPAGVETIQHLGTYVCRVIANTSTLSRHAYGDAIDIAGFDFDDGRSVTLVDDWEHDTTSPVDPDAAFLYDAGQRWHDDRVWNIILTPNYNAAHDDHFHVDLTPGSDFIGVTDGRYFGPSHGDCGGPGVLDQAIWGGRGP